VTNTPLASNVVILYDGVLRHLTESRMSFEEGKAAAMLRSLGKARDIFVQLQRMLRSDRSQDLFERLDIFYATSIARISKLPQKKFEDVYFRSLLSAIRSVRNAWAEVAGMAVRSASKPAPDNTSLQIMG